MKIVRNSGGVILPFRGNDPQVHQDSFIAENAIIVGDVRIGAGSSIWYSCVLRGDLNSIHVGENTNIQDGTVVHINSRNFATNIGDRVSVGHMALLHACTLQDDCMIGMRATVMDGAIVESGALVAAGALVTPGRVVPSGEVWAGSPAKFMRPFNVEDQKMLDYIWPLYVDSGREFHQEGADLRHLSHRIVQED